MKAKLTGEIDSEIEYGARWEDVKRVVIASAQAKLEDCWSLDDCKLFWLGRTQEGEPKADPHLAP
eukprot:COSAG02_NODE_980_length_15492_cov_12.941727_3_plen_65_part_00